MQGGQHEGWRVSYKYISDWPMEREWGSGGDKTLPGEGEWVSGGAKIQPVPAGKIEEAVVCKGDDIKDGE